ncbi:MAG: hypothetical protein HUU17_06760 [Chthonomonadales bacterium]|nr:hypothetical protein [Chthonomonadales bacterium]
MKRYVPRLSFILAAALCSGPIAAQNGSAGQQKRPEAPKSYRAEFGVVAESLANTYNVRLIVDPGLFIASPPTPPKEARSIEEALNMLLKGVTNSAWRRAYLGQAESSAGPNPARLAAMVRAIDSLETGGLVLENPTTRRAVSYQKNMPVLQGFHEELKSLKFDPVPIYVVYSTLGGGEGGSAQDRFLDLQRQQMELMMQMDPDTLASAMAQGMQMWMSLDPASRSRMLGTMMQAGTQMFMQMDPRTRTELVGGMMRSGMEMWANMPPDQRQRMTQEMMQMGQELANQRGGSPGGRP